MKLKIKVTKQILKESMYCGTELHNGSTNKNSSYTIDSNCAIACAIREIFPKATVGNMYISLDYPKFITLPLKAIKFISKFDNLIATPQKRLNLPEIEFTIDVPNNIIDSIDIEEAYQILSKSETLELVEA